MAYFGRQQALTPRTPRTPRSRAGRAEEVLYDDIDSEDVQYANYYGHFEQQQRAPLLASSTTASFPHRFSEKSSGIRSIDWPLTKHRIPLVAGLASVIFLAILVIMSVEKPETLHTYLHGGAPSPPSLLNTSSHDGMKKLSLENYTSFPLAPLEYRRECTKFLAGMKGPMGTYWHVPPGGPMDVPHSKDPRVCRSSITYMLDGYVGLAADLALITQAAGLARETNRTFFIDDRNWNRGRWTDHFQDVRMLQPGPEPGCLPPPPEGRLSDLPPTSATLTQLPLLCIATFVELAACPRTARHWVINSRTAVFHFGYHFMDQFENPYARELRRLKPIFQRAAASFAHTIRPSAASAELIRSARQEVGGPYVSMHARRGDRKTEAWEFRGSFVPLENYVSAVAETWSRGVRRMDLEDSQEPRVWVASDDPNASIRLIERLNDPYGPNITLVYSLETSEKKALRDLASRQAYVQAEFNALSEDERLRVMRGAIVDLALVTGLWSWAGEDGEIEASLQGTVCTISSNFCKLAAVGLGWERSFGFLPGDPDKTLMTMNEDRNGWTEIDLKGTVDPVWRPLELF